MEMQLSSLAVIITKTKLLIAMLDIMEEYKDLTIQEWNFRDALQTHLGALLHWQKIYWKQRSNIKWVKFGDHATEFFNARVSINNRINAITCLEGIDGQLVFDHKKKVDLLWEAYKNRLVIYL